MFRIITKAYQADVWIEQGGHPGIGSRLTANVKAFLKIDNHVLDITVHHPRELNHQEHLSTESLRSDSTHSQCQTEKAHESRLYHVN